ncbi:MAG: hypothetical protein AABY13_05850 [Nanoarchaeota archaeon]
MLDVAKYDPDAVKIVRIVQGFVKSAIATGVRPEYIVPFQALLDEPALKDKRHAIEQYAHDIYTLECDIDHDLQQHKRTVTKRNAVLAPLAAGAFVAGLTALVLRLTDNENVTPMVVANFVAGAGIEYVVAPLRAVVGVYEFKQLAGQYQACFERTTHRVLEELSRQGHTSVAPRK